MALPNNNITTGMVRNELGESTNNVGGLCTSKYINNYSVNKPTPDLIWIRSKYTYYIGSHSFRILKQHHKPIAPYNLGDFRGYDHDAKPKYEISIVEVTSTNDNTPLSNTQIYWGNTYDFKLLIKYNANGWTPTFNSDSMYAHEPDPDYVMFLTSIGTWGYLKLGNILTDTYVWVTAYTANWSQISGVFDDGVDKEDFYYGSLPPFILFWGQYPPLNYYNQVHLYAFCQQYYQNSSKVPRTWWHGRTAVDVPMRVINTTYMPHYQYTYFPYAGFYTIEAYDNLSQNIWDGGSYDTPKGIRVQAPSDAEIRCEVLLEDNSVIWPDSFLGHTPSSSVPSDPEMSDRVEVAMNKNYEWTPIGGAKDFIFKFNGNVIKITDDNSPLRVKNVRIFLRSASLDMDIERFLDMYPYWRGEFRDPYWSQMGVNP